MFCPPLYSGAWKGLERREQLLMILTREATMAKYFKVLGSMHMK